MLDNLCQDKRGFTLIELMAVIIILSLTATLGAVHLGTVSDQTVLKSTLASWRDLDAKARLHARSGIPVVLVLSETDSTLTIENAHTREVLASASWPESLRLTLINSPNENTIPFTPTGTSPDYAVRFATEEHTETYSIYGLTGYITRDQE